MFSPLADPGSIMNDALPLTKYHQIYLVLHEQLRDGRFAQGMPAEVVLAQQFGVGRVTVRRALDQLVNEGLIVRVAGRGTRPTPGQASPPLDPLYQTRQPRPTRLTGLMENIVAASRRTTVKVLEWRSLEASQAVACALQIPVGTKVRRAIRRRSTQEGPLSYITAYVPEALCLGFGRTELARKPILQLLEESGVELGRAQQTVSARQADAVVASELGVAIGTALLAVRRLVYDAQDKPIQWLHGLYRPDRYEYQMEVSQVGSIGARISVKEGHSD